MKKPQGPGAIGDRYQEGNPETGTDATSVRAVDMNAITYEIINLIEGAGLTLDDQDETQLFQAVNAIVTANLASAATQIAAGIVELATSAEAETGTDDTRALTPKAGHDTYAKRSQNLNDVADKSAARTNLSVYSKAEADGKYADKTSGSVQTFSAEVRAPSFQISSGRHLKTNIEPLSIDLDAVRRIRLYAFRMIKTGKDESGVIADEVAAVFPNCVGYDEQGRPESVDYGKLAVHLVLSGAF